MRAVQKASQSILVERVPVSKNSLKICRALAAGSRFRSGTPVRRQPWGEHPIAHKCAYAYHHVVKYNSVPQVGEPASVPPHREPNSRQRILVVEDDTAVRRVNTEVLTHSGYQVDAAEDGAAAWDALQLNNYDLVVTDNDMPRVTGVELIQKLQSARMALPVIMATGAVPDFTRYGSLQPAKTLLKPYTFDELLTAVKEVLSAASNSLGQIAPPSNWHVQPLADRFPR
jgi:CheY-like chemotaxis protein